MPAALLPTIPLIKPTIAQIPAKGTNTMAKAKIPIMPKTHPNIPARTPFIARLPFSKRSDPFLNLGSSRFIKNGDFENESGKSKIKEWAKFDPLVLCPPKTIEA